MAPKTANDAKFAETVTDQLDLLYRTAWTMTRSQTDAQDLVQETLLKAYKAIERFDGRYPRAWLLTIMRNTNINRGRKKKPDLLNDPDLSFEIDPAFFDDQSPEVLITEPLFDAEVEMALDQLSTDFRQVVQLVDIDALSYAETAAKLDIPVGTVMSRLHRARSQIREQLSDYFEQGPKL